jgi:RNA polymerase sigma-70 factor (ECF subfamily)
VLSGPEWLGLYDELHTFVRRRVRDDTDADDVTQGIFLKLYEALPNVREPQHVRAWAYRAARNAVIDYYRSRSRACREIFDEQLLETPAPDPDVAAAARLASCIPPAMQRLSPDDRDALERIDVDGQSQVAAARQLDLSVSGMKSRVQRARHRLKASLEQCCDVVLDRRGGIADVTPRLAGRCICESSCGCAA